MCQRLLQLGQVCERLEHEEVQIWNITQGTRLATYALEGPRGSGVICVNGAAAHLDPFEHRPLTVPSPLARHVRLRPPSDRRRQRGLMIRL